MLLENPYRRSHRARRNPTMAGVKGMTQGVDVKDVIAAVAGIAGAALIPNMIVKSTSTMGQKLMKLGVAAGITIAIGMIAKKTLGNEAGKMAVVGGLAGTATQAIGMFTSVNLTAPQPIRQLGIPTFNPSSTPSDVIVSST